jgi:hypothetical protein
MHKWQIGDWFEIDDIGEPIDRTRYLVFRVGADCYWGVPFKGHPAVLCRFVDTEPKHLPGCTGWDWQPPPREWWVNIYAAGDVVFHKTKEQADKTAGSARTGCIRVREVIE